MDAVEQLVNNPNSKEIIIYFIIALVAFEFLVRLWDWFQQRFGIETKFTKHEKEQSDSINELKIELGSVKKDQDEIVNALVGLKTTVDDIQQKQEKMQKIQDMNEAAHLKDRIGTTYRIFNKTKKITLMEKEALNDLIAAYTQYSSNSFVHTVVEPAIETWEVVDEN